MMAGMSDIGYLGKGVYAVKCNKCRHVFEAVVSGFNEKMGFDCPVCGYRSLVTERTWQVEMRLARLGLIYQEELESR